MVLSHLQCADFGNMAWNNFLRYFGTASDQNSGMAKEL